MLRFQLHRCPRLCRERLGLVIDSGTDENAQQLQSFACLQMSPWLFNYILQYPTVVQLYNANPIVVQLYNANPTDGPSVCCYQPRPCVTWDAQPMSSKVGVAISAASIGLCAVLLRNPCVLNRLLPSVWPGLRNLCVLKWAFPPVRPQLARAPICNQCGLGGATHVS